MALNSKDFVILKFSDIPYGECFRNNKKWWIRDFLNNQFAQELKRYVESAKHTGFRDYLISSTKYYFAPDDLVAIKKPVHLPINSSFVIKE